MSKALRQAPAGHAGGITRLCQHFGIGRDCYYKNHQRVMARTVIESQVLKLVKERRKEQPREGGRKLYKALKGDFKRHKISIGRDKLFEIMRAKQLLVKRKRAYHKTTNSYHRFRVYKNLIKDKAITKPNQVWVSDITYIKLFKGHCYLALITDLYSRKIVGYDISGSLELSGIVRAFKRAQRDARPAAGLIHHSDRGIQYCSNEYVGLLEHHQVLISMTEENHCYENAVAERVNGILKDEFYLDECFANIELAKAASKKAINVYNNKRLHLSLGYKTPEKVFKMRAKY